MHKKLILDRLEMLVKLCNETEPDKWTPGDGSLFSRQYITANEMISRVRNLHKGKQIIDPDSEREELISIMKCGNRIWKIRNKVKNGEWDDLTHLEMEEEIEDYITQGHKINAIKYYRQEMNDQFGEQITLREAKEHIDKIADDMRLRGIIKR